MNKALRLPLLVLGVCTLLACSKSKQGEPVSAKTKLECDDPLRPEEQSLDPDVVHAVVEENYRTLRYCYNQALDRNPTLQGQIDVNLVIEANGRASMVCSSASTLPSSEVMTCVLKAFSQFQYPTQDRQSATVYPISFYPN